MKMRRPSLPRLEQMSFAAVLISWQQYSEHTFCFEMGIYVTGSAIIFPAGTELMMLDNLSITGSGCIAGHGRPEPLNLILQQLQNQTVHREPRLTPAKRQADELAELVVANPWVAEYLGGSKKASSSKDQAPEASEQDQAPELDQFDVLWEELADRQRDQQLDGSASAGDDFVTSFQNGLWRPDHVLSWESERTVASAKAGPAAIWCGIYSCSKHASFSHSIYASEAASALSLEWCRRMQYFFNIWKGQQDPRYIYSESDKACYRPCEEWTAFLANLPGTGRLRTRASAIDAMTPSRPA